MSKRVGFAVVGLLCLLAIAPATAPVQLSYVYSDSMEPTIAQHDGYVLVPAGDVGTDDVVTFWSSDRDAYVTHRIVGESTRGFITKGDNNPTTDQAAGVSHVRQDDIVGQVLTVRGDPLVVPELGHAVQFVRANQLPIAALLAVALAAGLLRGRTVSQSPRSIPRARNLLWPVFAVAVVSAAGLQFGGGHTEQFRYVAVDSHADGPQRIAVGEARTESVTINRSGLPLTEYVVSADGMTITDQRRNATAINVTYRIPPPTETGVVTANVHVTRYAAVLPPGIIRGLHGITPLLAATATVLTAMLPIALGAALGIDGKRPLRPAKHRWLRTLERRWREL
jgi:signal peptidase